MGPRLVSRGSKLEIEVHETKGFGFNGAAADQLRRRDAECHD